MNKFGKRILIGVLLVSSFTIAKQASDGFRGASSGKGETPRAVGPNRREGEIPYQAYWGYHKDKSNQNLEGLFNKVVNEQVHLGYGLEMLPVSEVVLPFPEQMDVELSAISLYDGDGSLGPDNKIETYFIERQTGREVKGPDFTGEKYRVWQEHRLAAPLKVSALVLRKKKGVRLPDEIKFYGSYTPYAVAAYKKPAHPLKRMLGINAYPYNLQDKDPAVLQKKIAALHPYFLVRDYLDWQLVETQEGKFTFNPTHHGSWKLDEIYARHKANGKEILVCFKDIPVWMQETYPKAIRSHENAPMPYKPEYTTVENGETNYFNERYNADKGKPETYSQVAKAAFQFAARYGKNKKLNPKLVQVYTGTRWTADPANEKKIGLGLVDKIEANNEPDRYWKGRQANQSPDEYAAYLSAFYDGHKGTLGPGVGVKQADPDMLVVCGGIASSRPGFYQGLVDWCKKNRGYLPNGQVNLCFDEVNYHAYNNNFAGEQYAKGERVGVAPELSKAPKGLLDFHRINQELMGGKPIIITETGYDWNSLTQGTREINGKDKFTVQADWILRSSLEYAMAGLSGLYFYQLYDDGSGSSTNTRQYMTSGHVERNTYELRPAAQFLQQVRERFGEYVPVERLSEDPRVDQYRSPKGQIMYACWIPDETGRTGQYALSLAAPEAQIFTPTVGRNTLTVQRQKTGNGKLTVALSETPIFVTAAPNVK
ncbi:hypothetical protein [Rufibacter immobilis]|uniref:hypothetical protein n=1 Tax=Rufibacter immobilis TaxID=1348778 RepID=UPI0035E9CBF7